MLLKQNTARNRLFYLGSTGLTPTVTISQDGAAFTALSGTITEVSGGWYNVALATADTATLGDLAYLFSTGTMDATFVDQVVADLPGNTVASVTGAVGSVTAGVTVTTNNDKTGYSLTQSFPTNFSSLAIDSGGNVKIQSNIKKDTALNTFQFVMLSATDHVSPMTGLTVTGQRSIDGGAFGACSNTVSELSNGVYTLNLSASDLNGNCIVFMFTATGADTRFIELVTTP